MREKELRLALVCYGGISLAVYMHGITKEVWRLARASLNHLEGNPAAGGSQGLYRRLLQTFEDRAEMRLRVLVDIVAGASAGGINGVFLAQAVATGQSLEPLTQMWLDSADIDALLDPAAAPATPLTKVWALPIAWMVGNRQGSDVSGTVDEPARAEVRSKLARFIRSRWFDAPFGGEQLTGRILDALDAMAAGPAGPRLLPPGQPLDLFVTVTDFRGHLEALRLNSPPQVMETEHRLVVHFNDQERSDGTVPLADAAELAFAARATSSFPGAFPPFTVAELDRVLETRGRAWPGRADFLARTLPRARSKEAIAATALIDGSVLANAPFQPAIAALRDRPARRQIDRRFVFVDPTPNVASEAEALTAPGFFQVILGSLSELPRSQPIRDNLDSLAARTARIERMRGVLEAIRGEVEAEVESLFGYTLFLDWPTEARLVAWRKRAQAAAAQRAGYGYAAYARLKVESVVDRIAGLVADLGSVVAPEERRAIRAGIADVVAGRGEDATGSGFPGGASPATVAFLRCFDLGFRIRRLRLMARRLSELESTFARAECEPIREAIYTALGSYLELQRSDVHPELQKLVTAGGLRADPAALLDKVAETLDLTARDAAADTSLSQALGQLGKPVRRPMLLAYLGFPFFDVATLPLLQGEGLDEFDPVRVDRISPDDAVAIRGGGAAATLKGIQFNNFGAFFSRAYRENDYLWGRLHGADRLVDILDSTLPPDERLPAHRLKAIKHELFAAILDEEEPRLTAIPGLFAEIRADLAARLVKPAPTA